MFEVLCRNALSISSNDLPLVSGIKTEQTSTVTMVHPPKRKYAPKLLFDSKIGVVSATKKLATQLLPWARLVADARVRCGWISAAYTLIPTAQEMLCSNAKTYIATMTTQRPAPELLCTAFAAYSPPIRNIVVLMPMPP